MQFFKKKSISSVLKGNEEKRDITTLGYSLGRKVPGLGSEGKLKWAQRDEPDPGSVLSLVEIVWLMLVLKPC